MPTTKKALIETLAEQSFMLHVLNKRLVELGILQRDELRHLFELPSKEKENYLKDFTHQMAARGLHIDYVAKLRTWKRLRRGKRGNPR